MAHRKARNWALTLGISTTIALTGCGTSAPASTASETQQTTALDASETTPSAASSTTQSQTAQPAATGAEQTTGALTETYTAPDGSYSVKYPSSWKATTDKGYLELTSPDGTVTGHVSATGTYGPGEEWFTDRHLVHMTSYPAERLTELLGTTVGLYSGFKAGESPEQDVVAHGLSQVNASGMVSLGKTGSKEELWASFEQTGVNTTGKALTDAEAAQAVEKAVKSENGVTTQAILKSVEITPEASAEPPAQGEAEALTETFTSDDGRYSLKHPAGWRVEELTDGSSLSLYSPTNSVTGVFSILEAGDDWTPHPLPNELNGKQSFETPKVSASLGRETNGFVGHWSDGTLHGQQIQWGVEDTPMAERGHLRFANGDELAMIFTDWNYTDDPAWQTHWTPEVTERFISQSMNSKDGATIKAILQSITIDDAEASVG